jgi:hypothetical protein
MAGASTGASKTQAKLRQPKIRPQRLSPPHKHFVEYLAVMIEKPPQRTWKTRALVLAAQEQTGGCKILKREQWSIAST